MAKLLASSLLRTTLNGEIAVFRNSPIPLFSLARHGLTEYEVETPCWQGPDAAEQCLLEALTWRFKAAEYLDTSGFDKIAYIDADCLALRNIDHLFQDQIPITIQRERGRAITDDVFNGYLSDEELQTLKISGVNAGTIAWSADYFKESTQEWSKIFERTPSQHDKYRDQTSWNRLILDTPVRVGQFERDEIAFPFHLTPNYLDYSRASLVHFVGGSLNQKNALSFGLFMERFYHEQTGIYLDFLEP